MKLRCDISGLFAGGGVVLLALACVSSSHGQDTTTPSAKSNSAINDLLSRLKNFGEATSRTAQAPATGNNPFWDPAVLLRWRDGSDQPRSPCPMLNTLANHGILNYDGINITVESTRHAVQDILGLSGLVLAIIMRGPTHFAQIKATREGNAAGDTYDLSDTLEHNFIEHDVSLTRERRTAADPMRALARSLTKIDEFLTHADNGYITYKVCSQWRSIVRKREEADGLQPPIEYDFGARFRGAGEVVLMLTLIGRGGRLTTEQARQYLREERFPDDFEPLLPDSTKDVVMIAHLLQVMGESDLLFRFLHSKMSHLPSVQGHFPMEALLALAKDANNLDSSALDAFFK